MQHSITGLNEEIRDTPAHQEIAMFIVLLADLLVTVSDSCKEIHYLCHKVYKKSTINIGNI